MDTSDSASTHDDQDNQDSNEIIQKSRNGLEVFKEALDKFSQNRDQDLTIFSEIPEKCKISTCYVGIDEAGRGPVLGPMVYAIFASVADEKSIDSKLGAGQLLNKIEECPPTLLDGIKHLNDSKQVNEKLRDQIFAQFSDLDYVAFGIKIISPTQISDQSFKRQKISLNDVSHNAAMELTQQLSERGVKIGKVFVDTVGPMDKYQKKLELKFPELKFKVDKKADAKYKPVSAASICAKVTRDRALKDWTFPEVRNVKILPDGWGSGYPGDETTKKFLRLNIDPVFGFPNIVRDSWSTAADLLEKRAVPVKWEIEEVEAPVAKISKYFVKKQNKNAKENENEKEEIAVSFVKRKHQFYSYRDLIQTDKLF